jgi:poly(glycerol-phosphate) alpha-glucosyltransferase
VTRVYSIFERIGLGGGGKIKAVFHRMNALAEMENFEPILLNFDHSQRQKVNFADLRAQGFIVPRVQCLTVPEACYQAALDAGIKPFEGFPEFDQTRDNGKKTIYKRNNEAVMVDKTKRTSIGSFTKRVVPHPEGALEYHLIDAKLHQLIHKKADGSIETTDYVDALPIRWTKTQGRNFVIGRNLINGKVYRMPRAFGCSYFEMIPWDNSVVFFDGVTSAYLASVITAQRVLFLHADHRGPGGEIVPRSKFLIENFKGEAIITSTLVHKVQIEADVIPAAEVHVIPHFCESVAAAVQERRNLVTVSRLELTGKPIHECIEAFCRIKDAFPDVDYLIYGVGGGQKKLEAQIATLGCGARVHLMGYTTQPLAVFQGALASVYPTTTEGFGLSILEALSNGCPVISYDVNYGPREMIEPGIKGELVAPGDIDAIAEAMRRVLAAPKQYQDGTSRGLERYTRHAYLANYSDIVNKLVQEAARPQQSAKISQP